MVNFIKRSWRWVKEKWNNFEIWFASKLPGLKIKIIAFAGAVASMAGALQEYVTGLPLEQIVTPTKALIITAGLFTLSYWLRTLTNKA